MQQSSKLSGNITAAVNVCVKVEVLTLTEVDAELTERFGPRRDAILTPPGGDAAVVVKRVEQFLSALSAYLDGRSGAKEVRGPLGP